MSAQEETAPQAGSIRELLHVAIPLVLSSGSISLMHVIDRMYLTWYSTEVLAAALPAGIMHWTVMSVMIGTVQYINTFVAQYDGAGQKERVAASVWQGVYLSIAASILFLGFIPLAGHIFDFTGHAEEVRGLEARYFAILCAGTLPLVLSMALSSFFSGRGKTQVVMWVNFLIAATNIVLDYLMVFGIGPFPEMGIAGAAWATNLAYVAGSLAFIALLIFGNDAQEFGFWRARGFDLPLFRRLLRYGLPTGFQFLADIAGFSFFIFLIGKLGTHELAATNLAFNLNSLAFIPMFGFGTAVMTLVGKRIGEGRPEMAVHTTWVAFSLVGIYMLSFAAVYVLLPEAILYIYSIHSDPEEFAVLRDLTVVLLRFVALYSFFDGMAIVFGSAVRGAGDTRFSLIFTLITAWSVMVAPTWYLQHVGRGTLSSAWWACSAYVMIMGIGFMLRFQAGKWKSMRVIEETFADADSGDECGEDDSLLTNETRPSKHEVGM